MSEEIYNEILTRFVSTHYADPDWVRAPFMANGKACATDRYALVMVHPQSELPDLSEKVKSVLPIERNISMDYNVQVIREVLELMPKDEEVRTTEIECDECQGEGEVSWSYPGSHRSYEMDAECPVCDGDGYTNKVNKKTGRMVYDPTEVIDVNGLLFTGHIIEHLVWLAEKVGATFVRIVRSSQTGGALFDVGECELLLMPSMRDNQIIHDLRPVPANTTEG